MTRGSVTDERLRAVFERRADRAEVRDLSSSILAATRATAQISPWALRLRGPAALPRLSRSLVLALVAGALVGIGLIVAVGGRPAPQPSPSPTALQPTALVATGFEKEFEYRIPPGTDLRLSVEISRIHRFTDGPDEMIEQASASLPPQEHGVTVAVAETPIVHPCPMRGGSSRVPIRSAPDAFLEDLRTVAGVPLGDPEPSTLDGRPALAVTLQPAAEPECGAYDFHTVPGGIGSPSVPLNAPSRLIVSEIDDTTIVVQIWAASSEELSSWLPTAETFVESIHFVEQP